MAKITVRELALFSVLGALTFAAKYVMAMLPNIEPVSLMEILFFGLGLWNINYLYVWAVLAAAAYVLRDMDSALGWAMVSGVFGLLFGALCGIVDIFIGGIPYAITKWISGIPFDIMHCAGNFAIALLLFKPMRQLTQRLYGKMQR